MKSKACIRYFVTNQFMKLDTILIFSWRRRRPNTQDLMDWKNVEIDHLVVPPPATPREPGELSVDWEKILSVDWEKILSKWIVKCM